MSSKRPRPLDDPPAASSSEEEEEEEEETEDEEEQEEDQPQPKQQQQQQQQQQQHPTQSQSKSPQSDLDEDEEESEDSQEGDDETEDHHQPVKSNNAADKKMKNPLPQSPSPSPSGDSDSQKSPRASDFTIKPIAASQQHPETPLSKPLKRRAESSGKASKPKKPEEVRTPSASASTAKKSAITRLWSEEDEIVILKGLIDFQSKFRKDPSANQGEFHDFIKQSLHVDVSKNQLMDKVRRLKKKFKTNMDKSTNGEDPVLSKPHEFKSFHLSKKIWGNLAELGSNAANGVDDNNGDIIDKSCGVRSTKKSSRVSDKVALSDHVDVDSASGDKDLEKKKGGNVELTHAEDKDFMKIYPFLMNAIPSGSGNTLNGLNAIKSNLSLIGSSELRKLDDKWKELNMAETNIALRKFDLMQTQTRRLLDAMKVDQR